MLLGIIIGFVVGTVTGVFVMCVVSAGRENERLAETYKPTELTGKWLEHYDVYDNEVVFKCSKCGAVYDLLEGTPEDNSYNYCPTCGAYMVTDEE